MTAGLVSISNKLAHSSNYHKILADVMGISLPSTTAVAIV